MSKRLIFCGKILIGIVSAFLVSQFYIQLAMVIGTSMEPSFHNMQIVLVNKYADDFTVGDVVVARSEGADGYIIKRIVGVPGDTIQIMEGKIVRNNSPIMCEMYSDITDAGRAKEKIVVDEKKYFVMGDNHQHSIDSRDIRIGDIDKKNIIGKVVMR